MDSWNREIKILILSTMNFYFGDKVFKTFKGYPYFPATFAKGKINFGAVFFLNHPYIPKDTYKLQAVTRWQFENPDSP